MQGARGPAPRPAAAPGHPAERLAGAGGRPSGSGGTHMCSDRVAQGGLNRGPQGPAGPAGPDARGDGAPAAPAAVKAPCPRPSPFSRKYLTNCTFPNCSNTLRRNSACAEGRGALSEGGAAPCEPPAPATHACAAPRHHKQPAIGRLVYAERHGGRKE